LTVGLDGEDIGFSRAGSQAQEVGGGVVIAEIAIDKGVLVKISIGNRDRVIRGVREVELDIAGAIRGKNDVAI